MSITKTKVKRDGLQQYRVRVRYKDVTGKTVQVERTVYGYAEAQDMERELMRLGAQKQKSITIPDLCREYLDAKSLDVREATLYKAKSEIGMAILPYLSGYTVADLSVEILQKWKKAVSDRGLSVVTNKKYYAQLKAVLSYAVRVGYVDSNPLDRVSNFRDAYFEAPREKIQYYTKEQFSKYITQALKNAQKTDDIFGWGVYTFFCIAFFTGARKGEINALRWSDIDGDVMHIRRSVTQKIEGEDRFSPPKNKSSYRDIRLPAPLLPILEAQRTRQMTRRGFRDDDLVCGGKRPLRDSSVTRANTLFAEAAGVPHIRIHDFRHTHATLLINEGINVQEIARRLGHSDIKMTWNTYSHLYPREEERAIKILEKIEL